MVENALHGERSARRSSRTLCTPAPGRRVQPTRKASVTDPASPIMYRDQFGDAGRTLPALDLGRDFISDLQAVGPRILCSSDLHTATEPRAGRHGGEIADAVRA